jgi:tetraprenyl-beta-curcumene synthase
VARELTWSLPHVAHEVRAWRRLAGTAPDAAIRDDALSALAHKRGHTDGAALFCILPRTRSRSLLRVLVAYEIMWDFLDSANERGAEAGTANGRQLHRALRDGLDPSRATCDYYRHHPCSDDGGYLRSLVEGCRQCCSSLPSYAHVNPWLAREALRTQVLALNHDVNPVRRDTTLQAWATRERHSSHNVCWFELTGAASASLTIHALLALSAEPRCSTADMARAQQAYFPWISAATTMLDSYVDQIEDAANSDHSYVAHYPSQTAVPRIRGLIQHSMNEAQSLAKSEQHILIVACMIAMYLSKDSACSPALRETTQRLVTAGGSVTRLLLPILRLWRLAYAQRST